MATLIVTSVALIALAITALMLGRDAVIALAGICFMVFLTVAWLLYF